MLYVLLSALPFLTALVLMVGFRFSSARSLVISLVLTCALVLGVWHMTAAATAAYFVYGALKAMELLIIIGGAILLLNTMKQTGMMKVINQCFKEVSPTPAFRPSSSPTSSARSLRARRATAPRRRWRRLCWWAWAFRRWRPASWP